MATLEWPFKDPEEVLDYRINWQPRIGDDDPIVASTFSVVSGSGLTVDSDFKTDTTTLVWLSDGVIGTIYRVLNHIVTLGGREMEQTVKLKVKAK